MKKLLVWVLTMTLVIPCILSGFIYPVNAQELYVAETGGVEYTSLQDAIDNAVDYATIILLADYTFDFANAVNTEENYKALFLIDNKTVSIDLNGKKIFCDVNISGFTVFGFCAQNNAHLTILDSSEDKTGTFEIKSTQSVHSMINCLDSDSTTNSLYEAPEVRSTIVIDGGNFIADKLSSSIVYSQSDETVTVNGGYFYVGNLNKANGPWIFNGSGQNTRNILVNGGTFNEDIEHTKYPFEVTIPPNMALDKKTENGITTYTLVPCKIMVDVKMFSGNWYSNPIGFLNIEDAIATVLEPKVTQSGKLEPAESIFIVDDFYIEGDVTIPENVTVYIGYTNQSENFDYNGNLYINGNLTLEEGAKIIFNKAANINILGTLTNNGSIEKAAGLTDEVNVFAVRNIILDDNKEITETFGTYSGNSLDSVGGLKRGFTLDELNIHPDTVTEDIVAIGYKGGTPLTIHENLEKACAEGSTDSILLVKNTSGNSFIITKDKVIDLNNKTYTATGSSETDIEIASGVAVEFKNGKIETESTGNILIKNSGNLTITDIDISGNVDDYIIYNKQNHIIINGNTNISAGGNGYAIGISNSGKVEINTEGIIAGAFDADTSSLSITGGRYTEDVNKYCDKEYHAIKDDNLFTVSEHNLSDWKFDSKNHYKECIHAECKEIIESTIKLHTDTDGDKKCDICLYDMTISDDKDNENQYKEDDDHIENPNTNNGTMIVYLICICFVSINILIIASVSKKHKLNY